MNAITPTAVDSPVPERTAPAPTPVSALPRVPRHDAHYVFADLPRGSVTADNHGLHKYPAKFIPQIPRWALGYGELQPGSVVLDPFAGSGTTVLEAALAGHRGIGVEISPLGAMVTRAKTTALPAGLASAPVIAAVLADAALRAPALAAALQPGRAALGLHWTWSNWFETEHAAKLIALREAIGDQWPGDGELACFLLVCLSSVVKACSYLDENQIKVRLIPDKRLADPFAAFAAFAAEALATQQAMGPRLRSAPPAASVAASATALPLDDASVDRVITSPPYVNAVDYTMAHKYNLFVLGLVGPDDFKEHCRAYVGVTERAVRAVDTATRPGPVHPAVDPFVAALWGKDTATSRNRAYVVAQYFTGMRAAYRELHRVLRPGGLAMTVVGDNRICGEHVPTAALCAELARSEGFGLDRRFFHHVANVSSMRLNRSSSGGKVAYETVHVLRRD